MSVTFNSSQDTRTTNRDSQVIATSQFCDLSHVPEASAHDDGPVVIFLVVVEDLLHALDAGVLLCGVFLLIRRLVPIQNTPDEGGDEVGASFSGSNGLWQGEHEGQIAVDAVLGLEDVGGLDSLPC